MTRSAWITCELRSQVIEGVHRASPVRPSYRAANARPVQHHSPHLSGDPRRARLADPGEDAGGDHGPPDVRPTTLQITARLGPRGWTVEPMRRGLAHFWRNGKPLKDTGKGAGDGLKLTTFNFRFETCASASTFKALSPASAA